jgi:hypothetical protein
MEKRSSLFRPADREETKKNYSVVTSSLSASMSYQSCLYQVGRNQTYPCF